MLRDDLLELNILDDIKRRFSATKKMLLGTEKIINTFSHTPTDVNIKSDLSPVTIVDLQIEDFIRSVIMNSFPKDGIIGEEFNDIPRKTDYTWTIDPIDGTISFIHGVPLFATMIGLMYKDQPVMGLIHFPILKETIYAIKGQGAYWKPFDSNQFQCCKIQLLEDLQEATFCHSGINYFRINNRLEFFQKLQSIAKYTRSWGDAYGHMLVATGRAHLMIDPDPIMKIWDIVPIKIIVEEAGGYFAPIERETSIYKTTSAISSATRILAEKALKLF